MSHARTSEDLRIHNQVTVLRAVHDDQATATRSRLTRDLGLTRGTASVLVTGLTEARLLTETPAPPAHRGRPTAIPGPHPEGPIALMVDVREDGWELAAAPLGGELTTLDTRSHGHSSEVAFDELAGVLREWQARYADRVVGVALAVAGPVRDGTRLHAPHLAWRPTDITALLGEIAGPVWLDNDATLAALAEARRGRLRGTHTALHLYVDFDVGGSLVVDSQPQYGAHGLAGEFGHMRLTASDTPCPCGARGCWGLEVGANTLLRALDLPAGQGRGRGQAETILRQARAGESPRGLEALRANASALGSGIGTLVNGFDPQLVCLSGFGVTVLEAAEETLRAAYHDELMTLHRDDPPPVVATVLGDRGPMIGAMERVFDHFLTPEGIKRWSRVTGSE